MADTNPLDPRAPADGGEIETSPSRTADETTVPSPSSDPVPSAESGAESGAEDPRSAAAPSSDRLGWIALSVTVLLTVWHVVYFVNLGPANPDGQDVYISVFLFVSLVLAVATAVLGIVALSQRATPRWPAISAVSIGVYGFLTVAASWLGGMLGSSG